MKKESEQIEIFAGNAWETGMLKSLLENAEITVFIRDEIMGTYLPWWSAPGGAGAIRIFVAACDFDKAMIIVKEYEKNLKDNNLTNDKFL